MHKKNNLLDQKRNIENDSTQLEGSSSDLDYVEVSSKGCQSELLAIDETSSHGQPIDNNNDQPVNNCESFSSYNVSVERKQKSFDEDTHSQDSYKPMVASETMVFTKETIADSNNANQSSNAINDQFLKKRECPNYSICKGLNNIDKHKKSHWVKENCPLICDQNVVTISSSSSSDEYSTNQSVISIQTDDSQVKALYKNSEIPRSKSSIFKNKVVILTIF